MRQKYSVELGQKFGRWVVVDLDEQPRKPRVQCQCGTERNVLIRDLCVGTSTNCGCARREIMHAMATARNTTHGLKHHPHYQRWMSMRQRCNYPKDRNYARYGGRGIRVCDEWDLNAEAFITYLDTILGPCPDGHTLDRINPDGNYEPGNVRWADGSTQRRNQVRAA